MKQYKSLVRTCLAEWALSYRKRRSLTQEQMAEQLRITSRAYGDLERGRYCFSALALLMFLSILSAEERNAFFIDFRSRLSKLEQSEAV